MKKINSIKLLLDLIMAVIFVLLFNKRAISGLAFHEIAGLAIGLAFLIHIALNWRWVRQVTLNLFGKGVAIKTKIGYMVDVLLLIAMGYIIISGLLISKILFPNLRYGNEFFFKSTHISAAYITLALVGIHIGLHWGWVMGIFRRLFGITQKKKILGYIGKIALILVLAIGIYSLYSTSYFDRAAMITTAFSQNQIPGSHNQAPGQENDFNRTHQEGNVQPGTGKPADGNAPADANALNVLALYLGIISVFTIITYYIEKFIFKRRLKEKMIW